MATRAASPSSVSASGSSASSTSSAAIASAISAQPPLPHEAIGAKMIAGGLSCMLISALLNPMDVIKIRLQTQNQLSSIPSPATPTATTITATTTVQHSLHHHQQPSHHSIVHNAAHLYDGAKYHGTMHGLRLIYQEEGYARGLMRGVGPSIIREAIYSSIRMGLYDLFKSMLAPEGASKHDFTLAHKIVAGVFSGALGSSFSTPIDLVKIRFQSFDVQNPNPYRHTFAALADIGRREGLRGLYKGCLPTLTRAAVITSSQLASYDHSKAVMLRSGYFSDGVVTHLCASIIAGLVTTTTTNPFDVIKTRIMTDGTGADGQMRYKSGIDCAIKTMRSEGPLAFMKGWLPNYLRLGPHFILSLPLAEFIRVQLGADTI